ncbi:MAG: alpha/beta hydrolase [Calditrichaeota bacterium]|nr:alpha/beta hydrolase [Calditrichota bacterium]
MKLILLLISVFVAIKSQDALRTIEYRSIDGLKITADLYEVNKAYPTIIAFHQSGSSRGEYRQIAPELTKEGFNVLAVDLRWGKRDRWNSIENETAVRFGTPAILERYKEGRRDEVWPTVDKAYDDMLASYDWLYVNDYTGKMLIMGSSFSSILVFKMAAERDISAVLSYSPAEYRPNDTTLVRSWVKDLDIPVYFVAAEDEGEMVQKVYTAMRNPQKVYYQAAKGKHGASILFEDPRNLRNLTDFLKRFKSPQEVSFKTKDDIEIFADWYAINESVNTPVILAFNQGGSNVGSEYAPFVDRLLAAGFNVLAVDQRRGGNRFGGKNRTVDKLGDRQFTYCEAYPDLVAAMDFLDQLKYKGKRIAWGSSFSAALVVQLAANYPDKIAGVLAFSPASGEPMAGCEPKLYLDQLKIPALFLRPSRELQLDFVRDQFELFQAKNFKTYVARNAVHASSMLNRKRVQGDIEENWAVVLQFLESL